MKKYTIPIVFISGKPLKVFNSKKKIISFLNESTFCYIIRLPTIKQNKPGEFSLLVKGNNFKMVVKELPELMQKMLGEETSNLSET